MGFLDQAPNVMSRGEVSLDAFLSGINDSEPSSNSPEQQYYDTLVAAPEVDLQGSHAQIANQRMGGFNDRQQVNIIRPEVSSFAGEPINVGLKRNYPRLESDEELLSAWKEGRQRAENVSFSYENIETPNVVVPDSPEIVPAVYEGGMEIRHGQVIDHESGDIKLIKGGEVVDNSSFEKQEQPQFVQNSTAPQYARDMVKVNNQNSAQQKYVPDSWLNQIDESISLAVQTGQEELAVALDSYKSMRLENDALKKRVFELMKEISTLKSIASTKSMVQNNKTPATQVLVNNSTQTTPNKKITLGELLKAKKKGN